MQKLRLTEKKIARLSPDIWLEDAGTFSDGKNPWVDLFTEDVTKKIGGEILLRTDEDLLKLRLMLANAAHEAYRTFQFVGGAAAANHKKTWRNNAYKQSKALRNTLVDSDDKYSATSQFIKGKQVVRITDTSEIASKVNELISELNQFIEMIEPTLTIDDKVQSSNEGTKIKSQHKQYLQFVVDQMTEVFIHFEGRKNVKRKNDHGVIYGEYPEFIRAAAAPCLMAYYEGYRNNPKRPEKLNAQTACAVKRYGKGKL